jgi:pyrroloquinoline quinone (PQQ) biosynthesis protein C
VDFSDRAFARAKSRLGQASSHPLIATMLDRGMSRGQYRAFLYDLYFVVLDFCPAMEAAIPLCEGRYPAVVQALHHSLDEERNHERWVLHDIAAMGFDPDEAVAGEASPITQACLAFNRHYPAVEHPCGILGMLLALELIAATHGGQLASATRRRLGVTQKAGFGFLESHGELDHQHGADLAELLKKIDDESAHHAIENAAAVNIDAFAALMVHAWRADHALEPGPFRRWLMRRLVS